MTTIDNDIAMPLDAVVKSQRASSGVSKGKSGEREALIQIVMKMQEVERALDMFDDNAQSHKVQRNLQQSIAGGCDLVGIPAIAVEVKRQETLKLAEWWQQCLDQAKALDGAPMPVLMYRQSRQAWRCRCYVKLANPTYNHERWVVADLNLSDFLDFYADVYANWLLTAR